MNNKIVAIDKHESYAEWLNHRRQFYVECFGKAQAITETQRYKEFIVSSKRKTQEIPDINNIPDSTFAILVIVFDDLLVRHGYFEILNNIDYANLDLIGFFQQLHLFFKVNILTQNIVNIIKLVDRNIEKLQEVFTEEYFESIIVGNTSKHFLNDNVNVHFFIAEKGIALMGVTILSDFVRTQIFGSYNDEINAKKTQEFFDLLTQWKNELYPIRTNPEDIMEWFISKSSFNESAENDLKIFSAIREGATKWLKVNFSKEEISEFQIMVRPQDGLLNYIFGDKDRSGFFARLQIGDKIFPIVVVTQYINLVRLLKTLAHELLHWKTHNNREESKVQRWLDEGYQVYMEYIIMNELLCNNLPMWLREQVEDFLNESPSNDGLQEKLRDFVFSRNGYWKETLALEVLAKKLGVDLISDADDNPLLFFYKTGKVSALDNNLLEVINVLEIFMDHMRFGWKDKMPEAPVIKVLCEILVDMLFDWLNGELIIKGGSSENIGKYIFHVMSKVLDTEDDDVFLGEEVDFESILSEGIEDTENDDTNLNAELEPEGIPKEDTNIDFLDFMRQALPQVIISVIENDDKYLCNDETKIALSIIRSAYQKYSMEDFEMKIRDRLLGMRGMFPEFPAN